MSFHGCEKWRPDRMQKDGTTTADMWAEIRQTNAVSSVFKGIAIAILIASLAIMFQ